jgi:hypothetical protein
LATLAVFVALAGFAAFAGFAALEARGAGAGLGADLPFTLLLALPFFEFSLANPGPLVVSLDITVAS